MGCQCTKKNEISNMNLAESSSVKVSDEQYNSLDDAKQCVFNKSFFLLNSSILNKCF